MRVTRPIAVLAIALTAIRFHPLAAQIDYRNLDDHRPVRTEDAYPIERYAFELLVPYEYENQPAGEARHVLTPELGYGVIANTQVGLKLPFAAVDGADGTDWGFAGPRVFALYNLGTEDDFRRTAARNLIRAGVPQHVVMQLCGWKTDAMFRRYAIVDERDLRSAVEMLGRGTRGAQSKVNRMPGGRDDAGAKLLQ